MDRASQAALIIATFSVAHERTLELIRWWIGKLPWPSASKALDAVTRGAWAWLPAVALALITNANVFDALQLTPDHHPQFFANYLHGLPGDLRGVVGCCIMGLAVTFGAAFWHDVARSLIDLRARLQPASPAGAPQPASTQPGTPGQEAS